MALKQVLEMYELMDDISVTGQTIVDHIKQLGLKNAKSITIQGPKGSTDFVKFIVPGKNGKKNGGTAPTLGIVGRLGGLGARPERIGFVSDGDGALAASAIAAKLTLMMQKGDQLEGDVIICTHICPTAPTRPHEPVPFMDSPVDMQQMNQYEIDDNMDAVLSIDTTKGNRVININGFAISPTVKEGYILHISEDLLDIMQITTGKKPAVFPITTQDITPYGNNLYHLSSILQPSIATKSPTVGVAITTEMPVPGCATGATHLIDVENTVRFCIEVAKSFTAGNCQFYDKEEFLLIQKLYGPMNHIQTLGCNK